MVDDNAKFQGSVPVFYDRFLGNFYFEPYAAELARRLAVGREALVLEVACGTGILTRRLRAMVIVARSMGAFLTSGINAPFVLPSRSRRA